MGCDIHVFKEYQRPGTDYWVSYDTWCQDEDGGMSPVWKDDDPGRCYAAFGLLADVREGYSYGHPPKGLPENISNLVEKESDSWGDDGHSHTYHTKVELNAMIIKLSILPIEESDDISRQKAYIFNLIRIFNEVPTPIVIDRETTTRIVIWFDN